MKLNQPKLIGVTGGIATGKSTVSNIIKKAGYVVIDSDEISREIMEKGSPAYKGVISSFGKTILDEGGTLDRKKLGNIIFKDSEARERLNKIVHPHIFNRMKDLIVKHGEKEETIFLDIPLLIETMDKMAEEKIQLDEIWLVYADEATQLERLMARDKIGKVDALARIKSQESIESKRKYATKIIDNRGSLNVLNKQMKKILEEIG